MKLLIIDTTVFLNSIQQLLHLSLTPSSSGVGYSSLVSESSILKSILNRRNGPTFRKQQTVQYFIKGAFKIRSVLPNQTEIWNTLNYFKRLNQ